VGVVNEITTPQLAIEMFAEAQFTSTLVECLEGDLLALLTDGLIEVFDTANRELGFEWLKTTLAAVSDQPLRDIAEQLLAGAHDHGPQLDDQTILLIRREPRGTIDSVLSRSRRHIGVRSGRQTLAAAAGASVKR